MSEQPVAEAIDDNVKWLLDNTSLCTVSVREFSASRTRPGRKAEFIVEESVSFAKGPDHVHFRSSLTVNIVRPDSDGQLQSKGEELGKLSAVIVASYKTESDPHNVDRKAMSSFARSVASGDLLPFARQTLSGLALQLGFDSVPLIRITRQDIETVTSSRQRSLAKTQTEQQNAANSPDVQPRDDAA